MKFYGACLTCDTGLRFTTREARDDWAGGHERSQHMFRDDPPAEMVYSDDESWWEQDRLPGVTWWEGVG